MSEEEESVFERMIRVLSDVNDTLNICTEALVVIATEMYEARRDLTKLVEQINDSVSKIAGKPREEWKPEAETVKVPTRYEEMVIPKSTLPKVEEEKE
jgi:hypothetical protein